MLLAKFFRLWRKDPGKESSPKEPPLRGRFLGYPPGDFWPLRFQGAKASPRGNFFERSPLVVCSLGAHAPGWLLFLRLRHGVKTQTFAHRKDNVTQIHSGDLAVSVPLNANRSPQDHLYPQTKGWCAKEYHNNTKTSVKIVRRNATKTKDPPVERKALMGGSFCMGARV